MKWIDSGTTSRRRVRAGAGLGLVVVGLTVSACGKADDVATTAPRAVGSTSSPAAVIASTTTLDPTTSSRPAVGPGGTTAGTTRVGPIGAPGVADPRDYATSIDKCAVAAGSGVLTAHGSLVNKSSRRQAFDLSIEFDAADGTQVGRDAGVHTTSLEPGQRADWAGSSPALTGSETSMIACKISQVNSRGG